jgi:LysM repeat protein
MTGYEYYNTIEKALAELDRCIAITQKEAEGKDEFHNKNYAGIFNGLYQYRNQLLKKLSIHRFAKLSKEDFILQNDVNASKSIQKYHKVKSYETGTTIAKLYGTTLENILKVNNVRTDEIVAGKILKINITPTSVITRVYENVPTYGSQLGDLVYGKDLPDELATEDGDLKVLDPIETLRQGIYNRVTTQKGGYPFQEDFGIGLIGEDFPEELSDSMFMVEVQTQLSQDARISSIDNLTLVKTGGNRVVIGNLTAITGAEIDIN